MYKVLWKEMLRGCEYVGEDFNLDLGRSLGENELVKFFKRGVIYIKEVWKGFKIVRGV